MLERIRRMLHLPGRDSDLDALRSQVGSLEARLVKRESLTRLRDAEFRVFSQFGEDGIIQYLLAHVEIPPSAESFVEFGVESYRESNTRFLLVHDNWRGLILDSGSDHVDFIERMGLRWRHTIDAVQLFIDRDNLPEVLLAYGFVGDLGLLSIDLDGIDYWVWEALDDKLIHPRIVVVEYNSLFGPEDTIAVPYDRHFQRMEAHQSSLYWGASLAALVHLGIQKGYTFVGSNSAGNNAFFVRQDVARELHQPSVQEEWVASRFRESRDAQGRLTYLTSHGDRRREILNLPVVNVVTGETIRIGPI